MTFFERIPAGFLWVAILVLAIACVGLGSALNYEVGVSHHNDVYLCGGLNATTKTVNTANKHITALLQTSLNNTLKRIGTSKELPTDKASVQPLTVLIASIKQAHPLDCGGLK